MTAMISSPLADRMKSAKEAAGVVVPVYGEILAALEIVPDASVNTLALKDDRLIFFNPDFVESITDDQLLFGLCVMAAMKVLGIMNRREDRDPRLWNIAACYLVNAMLIEQGVIAAEELPFGAMYSPEYTSSMTTEEIYEKILGLDQYAIVGGHCAVEET